MNFPNVIQEDCIPTTPPSPDERCNDPAFALLHPDICQNAIALRIKPGTILCCVLGSVQFKAFTVINGVETELTSGVVFSTSDPSVILIGAISGNATGVGAGTATITASYQGITATAGVTVLPGANCCQDVPVSTMIVLDKSKSMSQAFGGAYATKLDFAKFLAGSFAGQTNVLKDKIGLIEFDSSPTTDSNPTSDKATVVADAGAVVQSVNLTGIGAALQSAADILATETGLKVILLISDGEDKGSVDVPTVVQAFKDTGGILMCAGVRSHSTGFNLLNAISTGGFFINSYLSVVDDAIQQINGLKGYVCGGQCVPTGDVYENEPQLDYSNFINWDVTQGHVDLIGPGLFDVLPGNGLYVSLVSNIAPYRGEISTKSTFNFVPGKTYRVSFDLAGNNRMNLGSQTVYVKMGTGAQFQQFISVPDYTHGFSRVSFSFNVLSAETSKLIIGEIGNNLLGNYFGCIIDNVVLEDVTDMTTMFVDDFNAENLVFVPPACGVAAVFGGGGSDDPDLLAFVAATGLSDQTQIAATRKFISTLKQNGIWDFLDAIYPMMGSSASEHSYNLKNPAQHQITWVGSVTHGLNSVISAGGYGDTNFNPATAGGNYTQNLASMGMYCKSLANGQGSSMGNTGVGFTSTSTIYAKTDSARYSINGLSVFDFVGGDGNNGFYFVSRTSPTNFDCYWPTGGGSGNVASNALVSQNMYLLTVNADGVAQGSLPFELAFACFGGGLTPIQVGILQNAVNDLIALSGISGPAGYTFYYGYNCYGYGCLSEPPGTQQQDTNPLADIEAGYVPPTTYTSTRSYTAKCPNGTTQIGPDSSVPVMTSFNAPSGTASASSQQAGFEAWRAFGTGPSWKSSNITAPDAVGQDLNYVFPAAKTIVGFAITPGASLNGVACTVRLSVDSNTVFVQSGVTFLTGVRKYFSLIPSQLSGTVHQLTIFAEAPAGLRAVEVKLLEYFEVNTANTGITKSATESSTISQADADAKALAAATELALDALSVTGCATQYSSTQSFTAKCPAGEYDGNNFQGVTKSASATSYVSQADADAKALAAATAAAQAALDCTQANNNQPITINDFAPATPYPSVAVVSGLTGNITRVRVNLLGYHHANESDVQMILLTPAGDKVLLMRNCGGAHSIPAPINLTFDSNSATPLPSNAVITAGSYKPTQFGIGPDAAAPGPAGPYASDFTGIVGQAAAARNGSWSLWVQDIVTLDTGAVDSGWTLQVDTA